MAAAPQACVERRRVEVRGVVQGVGFRPFVYRLARDHGIAGFVLNDANGAVIEAEGDSDALDRFVNALVSDPPSLARVDSVAAARLAPRGDAGFAVAASHPG